MHISQKFDNKRMKSFEDPKNLPQLHVAHNNAFATKEDIQQSEYPAKKINSILVNESIFSFSFVRHPYAR